ncbi:toprim domain-containing protein, partial [Bradyrhizobium sp. UNPA324]|uniref:toprim domain-containing protein n=1 Tax=Bradyrhizobium sp. UNPA324 TaxID=1141174 RepID=UPI0015EEDA7C
RERLERERIEREALEAAELRETIGYCERLWSQTVPLPPAAIAYFARRGITLDDVPDQGGLRFLSACPFDGVTLPCIVARFTDPVTNGPGGLWRRPLSGEKPKSIGPIRARVIRLWPDEYVEQGLVIGEGIETTLAAATRAIHCGTLLRPAWACGHADNLRKFPVLSGIEALTILADNDASGTGQDAARECAERWEAADRWVEVLTPTQIDADFDDLAMRGVI